MWTSETRSSPARFLFGLAFAALGLCFSPAGRAALLVYEGFNYPAGSGLTNASAVSAGNSFGWADRWHGVSKSFATNVAFSLPYADTSGNQLLTDGGKIIVGIPAGTTADNAQPGRSFNLGTLSGNAYSGLGAGTYWVSFTMQWVGQRTAGSTTNLFPRKGDLAFKSGAQTNANGGTELIAAGRPNASSFNGTPYDMWTLWSGGDSGAGASAAATTAPLTNVTFVLMRLDIDGTSANDTAYLWANWTSLTNEPAMSTANATNTLANLTGLNSVRLDANNGNAAGTNTVLAFDEFRLGTSFADVVPRASVPQAPNIASQPLNQTVTEGTPATFFVTAVGDAPLHYQWYFNTNSLVGSDTNYLTIANASNHNAGSYFVIVTNHIGAATSSIATLTVVPPVPAAINTQPVNQTVVAGDPVTFSVAGTGTAPLRYQWFFNNTLLTNQTNAALNFASTTTNDAGGYSVIVTNNYGADTSLVATLTVIPPFERLPAFPGADGAARYVTGGRGGIVYHVTKLDRSFSHNEPGTLRYGLTDGNFPDGIPRTIVFDVAGAFWLGRYGTERPDYDNGWDTQSRYNIPSDITIAGQSAPGPVIIMGGVTKPGGNNIIIRNITFAPGYGMKTFHEPDAVPPQLPTPGDFPDSVVYDALDISGQNVMLDHLTTIYGTDETISANELAANITIQNCIIAQGQNYPQGDAENPGVYTGHALGSLLQAGSNARISVLNNLYAHLKGRLPRVGSEVGTGAWNDFRNNVFYNWFGTAGGGGSAQPSFNNFINNFYLAGPGGDDVSGTNITTGNSGGTGIFSGAGSATRAYITGNFKDTNKDRDPNDAVSANGDFSSIAAQPTAYSVNIGATLSAQSGLTNVLRYVGTRWWARPYNFTINNTNAITTNDIGTYVDQRLIKETFTGTGKIRAWADDPFDANANEGFEWRGLLALRADSNTFSAPFTRPINWDTDDDGMPDGWELGRGLDPNVVNNNGDFDNDGYTDLEEYLNELAAWPAPGEILFNNTTNNRYAEIFNWSVAGAIVNIGGSNVTTFSKWQPSRYDTAVISNRTCIVDAVGQHAGSLRLTNGAVLNITNGWLSLSSNLHNSAGSTLCVLSSGGLRVSNNFVNAGTLLLAGAAAFTVGGAFTNTGTLDIMTWNGVLPGNFVNLGTVLTRSLIALTSCRRNGNDFTVTIHGYTRHNYQLQYSGDLGTNSWQNVGTPVAGANAPIEFTHTGGTIAGQRFYRVAVMP